MTALGAIVLWRAYFSCRSCRIGGYLVDHLLGLDGFLTRQATRLVCLLGGRHSYAAAFATAGDIEFQVDAAKVNTTGGWRDMKVGIFARRERGEAATPAEWDERELPAPTARVAFAAIQSIDDFAPRWREWADRLKITDRAAITVLGDGAEWIWNAAARQFGGCHEILDIYHAAEYVSDAGKGLFGEGTLAAAAWLERGRGLLLSDGWAGLCDHIGATLEGSPALAGHAALGTLTGYFAAHTGRLNYCHRLYTGQSIGSGMVEGAAKNLIGRRLKQTGARWRVENVNQMAELCCLTYSDQWEPYWASPN
jgi:hypothetical protein